MKNPLKLFGVDFDELFPVWVIKVIAEIGVAFFFLGLLCGQADFVYIGIGLFIVFIVMFILTNLSQAFRLLNEGETRKAIIRFILMFILATSVVFIGYRLSQVSLF